MSIDTLRELPLFELYRLVLEARGITALTEVQEYGVEEGILTGASTLVAAPTSSGKTLLGEFVAMRNAGAGLTAFVVSHRALAMEVFSLFQEHFAVDGVPLLRPGINTGEEDTVHGRWRDFDVIVFTYEKFLGSLSSSPFLLASLRGLVVDEVQHMDDQERGHVVELLLSRWKWLRDCAGKDVQLLALSATLARPEEIAKWLGVTPIVVTRRDPPLDQEVWLPGWRYKFESGSDQEEREALSVDVHDVGAVVRALHADGLGPVGVMATMRRNASYYASVVAREAPVDAGLAAEANEFRGLGEETTANEEVVTAFMRGVGLHHADMPRDQRYLVEQYFREGRLRTLVATPTLVAGVNLPFRTVLYPTVMRWNGTREAPISHAEFVNGVGRAGRRGYHARGTAVVLCETWPQFNLVKPLVTMEPQPISSRLAARSVEYLVLHALSGTNPFAKTDIQSMLGCTFAADRDPEILNSWHAQLNTGTTWGETVGLWTSEQGRIKRTMVGAAVAASGLEPRQVVEAVQTVTPLALGWTSGAPVRILLALSILPCMEGYAPYSNRGTRSLSQEIRPELERLAEGRYPGESMAMLGVGLCLHAIGILIVREDVSKELWSEGAARGRYGDAASRILRAVAGVLEVAPDLETTSAAGNLRDLADCLAFQVPCEAVGLARVFAIYRVRHVGRARYVKLAKACGGEPSQALHLTDEQLRAAVGTTQVAGVRDAISRHLRVLSDAEVSSQARRCENDPGLRRLAEPLFTAMGTAFELSVAEILAELGWTPGPVDQEGSTPFPDLTAAATGHDMTVECKTSDRYDGEVNRKEVTDSRKKFGSPAVPVGRLATRGEGGSGVLGAPPAGVGDGFARDVAAG